MMYALNKERGSNMVLISAFVFAMLIGTVLALVPTPVGASVQDAQNHANAFCPRDNEIALADYMWITNPQGGSTFNVIEGQSQQVDVTLNVYVTYCKHWGSLAAKAIDINAGEDTNNDNAPDNALMSGQPGEIGYPNATSLPGYQWGTRIAWGPVTYSAKLDVSQWAAGSHRVCTTFATVSIYPYYVSPSGCTTVNLTRTSPWTTSGESKVGVDFTPPNVYNWSASPNQMLYWRHTISAAGGTTPGLGFAVGKSGFSGANVWGDGSSANHNKPVGTTSAIGAGSSYGVGWGANRPEYSEYRVQPSDGGRTLCQNISWGPSDYTKGPGDAWASSNNACVEVPFNYDLTPGVSGINGVTTVGASIPPVFPTVNNSLPGNASATTDSPPVEWQLKRIEVPPTGTISMTQADNGTAPCAHYGYVCIDKGSGTRTFSAGAANPALATLAGETVAATTPIGTQICYTLSVQPYKVGGSWRHSAPVCVRVSKQPKVQVWGHDVRTRGQIDTGLTEATEAGTNKLFGSWVEYGGFSVDANAGFASGSGLNGGNTNTDREDKANVWNKLTFANVDDSSPFKTRHGFYTLPNGLPTITDQFIGSSSGGAPNSDLTAVASGTYNVGDFTIDGGQIADTGGKGKVIIIVSTGTVKIEGNIIYKGVGGSSDVFTAIDQLPQVIIIAKNIEITGAVTQIDAWLLALDKSTPTSGSINTCSDVPLATNLTAGDCTNTLTVNGPVVARHLHLRRTAGSDSVATAGTPAEVFNLRPDTFLWAQARAGQAGKAQTVYSVELPPRF